MFECYCFFFCILNDRLEQIEMQCSIEYFYLLVGLFVFVFVFLILIFDRLIDGWMD